MSNALLLTGAFIVSVHVNVSFTFSVHPHFWYICELMAK